MRSPRLPASTRPNKADPKSESMSYKRRRDSFAALIDIIARLRGPDGCPWDREQTHLSLKPTLVEECYEVLEAVDEEDDKKLCEELGDLLMQIALHAQIADDQGKFGIKDVLQGINTKLIHRHPHVFGEAKVSNSQEVILSWEALKQKERGVTPLLAGLPKGMPALAYSQACSDALLELASTGKTSMESSRSLVRRSRSCGRVRTTKKEQENSVMCCLLSPTLPDGWMWNRKRP